MLRFIRERERGKVRGRDRKRRRERDSSASKTGRGNFTHHFYCNLLQMFVAFGFVWLLLLLLLQRVFLLFFFCSLLARLAFGLWQNLQLLAAVAVAAAKFYLSQVASVAYIWQVNVVWGGQEKKPGPDAQPISSQNENQQQQQQQQEKQENNHTTTTKSSAGWRLQLGLIHCILLLYLRHILHDIIYLIYMLVY